MSAPWAENQFKVVVEFRKSSQGARRIIHLQHNGAVLPPQLAGRISPAVWQAFMADIDQVAQQHPYVVAPSADRVCGWLGGAVMGAVLGFCCMNPDGGDYSVWLQQVQAIIQRHQPAFQAGGATLSLQHAQLSYWVQIDINPDIAVGQPVLAHQQQGVPYTSDKPGYEPYKQGL